MLKKSVYLRQLFHVVKMTFTFFRLLYRVFTPFDMQEQPSNIVVRQKEFDFLGSGEGEDVVKIKSITSF